MPQLRRSDLFVADVSRPAKSPVGAACSASMPLPRSFDFLTFAIYKHAAPMGLGKAPLALNSMAVGQWPGYPKTNLRTRSKRVPSEGARLKGSSRPTMLTLAPW
jgi:hypothetical protein